jgi:hypothetical protein
VSTLEMTVLEVSSQLRPAAVSPDELARFKDKHGELLRRFRREVETFAMDATMLNRNCGNVEAQLFRDKLADQLEEVSARMKPRWPRIIFGRCAAWSLQRCGRGRCCGGAALARRPVQRPGLASAVYAAFGDSKEDWRGSSVAYAALAQNRFRSTGA